MLKNHGRLGFQIEAVPTQCSVRKFVNRLKFLYEPWREDINAIHEEHFFLNAVNKEVKLMELHDIDRTDGDLVGEGKASTSKYNEEKEQEEILTNAVKKVRSVWRDMVKQVYLDNASEIMLHSHKSENGDIIKINIPYVENIQFRDFLENSIHDVYNAAVHQLPYKMGIAFGFMLLDTEKTTVRHWYVDKHLTRTPQNKDILLQVPNLFVIKNKNDEIQLLKTYINKTIFIWCDECFIHIVFIFCE